MFRIGRPPAETVAQAKPMERRAPLAEAATAPSPVEPVVGQPALPISRGDSERGVETAATAARPSVSHAPPAAPQGPAKQASGAAAVPRSPPETFRAEVASPPASQPAAQPDAVAPKRSVQPGPVMRRLAAPTEGTGEQVVPVVAPVETARLGAPPTAPRGSAATVVRRSPLPMRMREGGERSGDDDRAGDRPSVARVPPALPPAAAETAVRGLESGSVVPPPVAATPPRAPEAAPPPEQPIVPAQGRAPARPPAPAAPTRGGDAPPAMGAGTPRSATLPPPAELSRVAAAAAPGRDVAPALRPTEVRAAGDTSPEQAEIAAPRRASPVLPEPGAPGVVASTPSPPKPPEAPHATDATPRPPLPSAPGEVPSPVPVLEPPRGARRERGGEEPPIRVSIGRITVEAPPAPAEARRSSRPRPALSLSDYLDRRRGR
jgi:hypothetical protein